MSKKYTSVDMKNSKFLKINNLSENQDSENAKNNKINSNFIRNRFSSYLTKVPRKNSYGNPISQQNTQSIYRNRIKTH